jgi:hypothetical protein
LHCQQLATSQSRQENEINLPLIELEIPQDRPNFRFVEDYWFWNWQQHAGRLPKPTGNNPALSHFVKAVRNDEHRLDASSRTPSGLAGKNSGRHDPDGR